MPLHSEHHAFPQVPFYKLPELHDLLLSRTEAKNLLDNTGCNPSGINGYVNFHIQLIQNNFLPAKQK